LGEVPRLQWIERPRQAAFDVAEPAAAGADLAHQHHGGGAGAPALAHVRATRLFADGGEVQLAQRPADVLVPAAAGHADLQPVGFWLTPLADLDEHGGSPV